MAFSKVDSNRIKGLAILFMMFHHLFLAPDRYEGYEIVFWPFEEASVNYWSAVLRICVPMFVFVSSYGITIKTDACTSNGEVIKISFNRYVKMISNFCCAYVFVILVSILLGRGDLLFGQYDTKLYIPLYMLLDLLGVADLLGTPLLIGTYWYMSVAVMIIFVTPFIIYVYKRGGGGGLIGVLIFLSGLEYRYVWFQRYFLCMIMGAVFAKENVFAKINRNSKVSLKLIIRFVGEIFLVYILGQHRANACLTTKGNPTANNDQNPFQNVRICALI